MNTVFTLGTSDYDGMVSLARRVAKCGSDFEEIVKQRRNQDPSVWYLFHKESAAYKQYQQLVKEFKREIEIKTDESQHHKPGDLYEPEEALMQDHEKDSGVKRKRKSRWGDKVWFIPPPTILNNAVASPRQDVAQNPPAVVTRNNPGLIQDTINTHGSKNLTEKEWKKDEDRYKISLLQKELKKKREFEEIQKSGKNKYNHYSDKAVNGRTWEPKLRDKEVKAMPQEAERELHTPEELNNLTQKKSENKDGRMLDVFKYEEFKINEDNIGFKMLQKLGWSKGQGLGKNGAGIVEPIKQTPLREPNQGLGVVVDEEEDDEFAAYRKRLAYKQRTNPLNNSR